MHRQAHYVTFCIKCRNLQRLYNEPIGKSYHLVLNWTYNSIVSRAQVLWVKRLYHDGNYDKMREDLEGTNWVNILKEKTVDEQWIIILTRILDAVNTYFQQKTIIAGCTTKCRKPLWMNESPIRMKRNRSTFKLYKQTREGKDYLDCTKARNTVKAESRQAVRDFEREITKKAKTNPKAFYSFVNSKLRMRPTIGDLRLENGAEVYFREREGR